MGKITNIALGLAMGATPLSYASAHDNNDPNNIDRIYGCADHLSIEQIETLLKLEILKARLNTFTLGMAGKTLSSPFENSAGIFSNLEKMRIKTQSTIEETQGTYIKTEVSKKGQECLSPSPEPPPQ